MSTMRFSPRSGDRSSASRRRAGERRAGGEQVSVEPQPFDDTLVGVEAPREILTWATFGTATRELAQTIADDGYRPDVVIAVARGGLTVAGALAYALGVKNCGAMNLEFY